MPFVYNIDDGYSDGYSIFEFKFNKNDTNRNRWDYWQEIDDTNVSPESFIGEGVLLLDIDDLIKEINVDIDFNNESLFKLCNFDNNEIETINIPLNNLHCFEILTYSNLALFLQYDGFIFGVILIVWKKLKHNMTVLVNETPIRKCTLVGGGNFYPPIAVGDYHMNVNDHIAGKFIPLVESQIISKLKSNVKFDSTMEHSVAVCRNRATIKWCGDHKCHNYLFGIPSASVSCACAYCISTLQDRQQLPTPHNRQWFSRNRRHLEQSWISNLAQTNEQSPFNLTNPPLLVSSPSSLALAVLHQIQGPAARLFTIIKKKLMGSQQLPPHMKEWNQLKADINQLETEITQYTAAIEWISDDNNEEIFDHNFVENLDSNIDKLKSLMDEKKKLLANKKMRLNSINNNNNGKCKLKFLTMCDELNIKPWHHKGDTMHGPSVKKFIYNYEVVLKYLKECNDETLLKLMEPCLARMKFVTKCFWTKSKKLFSDECVYRLKWNIIEWDHIYHQLINKYGGGNGYRLGYKWHGWYHSFEHIEHERWSTAYMDDQRVEQFNVHIGKFLPIYSCFRGHINLKRMMNKLWREFLLG